MFVLPERQSFVSRYFSILVDIGRNQDFVALNPGKCLPVVSADCREVLSRVPLGRGEAMRRRVTCGNILG